MKTEAFALVNNLKDPKIMIHPLTSQAEIYCFKTCAASAARAVPGSNVEPIPVFITDQDETQLGTFMGYPFVIKTTDPMAIEIAEEFFMKRNAWIYQAQLKAPNAQGELKAIFAELLALEYCDSSTDDNRCPDPRCGYKQGNGHDPECGIQSSMAKLRALILDPHPKEGEADAKDA